VVLRAAEEDDLEALDPGPVVGRRAANHGRVVVDRRPDDDGVLGGREADTRVGPVGLRRAPAVSAGGQHGGGQ
jgi:hypothetical protein